MRDAQKGRIVAEETKKALSEGAKRAWADPEKRERISASRRGKKLSDEARARIKAGWLKRKARKQQKEESQS